MNASEEMPAASPAEVLADAVTGAYSRAFFEVRLREEADRVRRSGLDFSVCLFDVDHFKSVNDAFGHVRGDQVLRQVVDRINCLLRGSDAVFRYGGDEFVLLLPDAGRAQAAEVGARVVAAVGEGTFDGEPPLQVTISLGVASCPEDADDPAGLVSVADRRSYLAKSRGRGCAVVDDATTGVVAGAPRLLERDAAMTAAHAFLGSLPVEGSGVLRVAGERGGGHTRFLDELGKIADLRGTAVVRIDRSGTVTTRPQQEAAAGVLVLVDGEANWSAAAQLARGRLTTAPWAGLVLAGPGAGVGPTDAEFPLRTVVELGAWSAIAVRVWLRTRLRGEPSADLVAFVSTHSGGLPARAERLVARLVAGDGIRGNAGGWTLTGTAGSRSRPERPLPQPLTELVGRGEEIDQLIGLLASERLVTLVGPGGIGKTRLSLAVAGAVAHEYGDGAVFVPLAEATTADHVNSAVAQALHITEVADQDLADLIGEQLAARELLLVLDNFEQVRPAAVQLAGWLAQAPGLTVLLTTRERLRLSAERVYAVPPLSLPERVGGSPDPGAVALAVARSSALGLFVARAQRVAYDFRVTARNLPALSELCHLLDGLPLAIELAAAHIDTMIPDELLSRLSCRLDLLGDGPVDLPARQQTLRSAIGWSYDLLDSTDRRLFTALGAFAGGCRAAAIQAVSGTDRLAERMAGLVEKSLVQVDADPDGEPRFVLLETIRAYAAEQLTKSPAGRAGHARHAAYYAAFAEEAKSWLRGPDQLACLNLIGCEQHNIRAALVWALDRGDGETAGRIAAEVWPFWACRGQMNEGRDWVDRVLGIRDRLPPPLLARLLYAAGCLAVDQGDVRVAVGLMAESLACARAIDDRVAMLQALRLLGRISTITGDYERARALHEESLALARAEAHHDGIASALGDLGDNAIRLGNLDEAEVLVSESLKIFRSLGDTLAILCCISSLGEIFLYQGEPAAARPMFDQGLALSREVGDVGSEAWSLHYLGMVAELEGKEVEAAELFTAALSLRHDIEERQSVADSLEGLAGVMIGTTPALAARLFGAAEALRERHQLHRPPVWQRHWEAHLRRLTDSLDESVRSAAWDAGRDAELDQVVADALTLGTPEIVGGPRA